MTKWTDKELSYLKENWENKQIPTQEICDFLGRKMSAVSKKARELGLFRGQPKLFTDKEIAMLIKNYPLMSNEDLQKKFFKDKTVEQVANAGWNRGLKKAEDVRCRIQIDTAIKNLKKIDGKGDKNHRWKAKVDIKCSNCGKSIKKLNSKIKGSNFCSISCKSTFYKTSNRGSGNPNFKGGDATLRKYGRGLLKQWKKDSMRKCGFRCVVTGKQFLDIHHVKSYEEIFNETVAELGLSKWELVEDLDDETLIDFGKKLVEIHYRYPLGVCLTREIHDEFHAKYGRVTNEKEWLEFYKNKQVLSGQ